MGIRGLTQALKGLPVGTQVTLHGKSVVIDGPALVHRLWEVLMKDQHSSDVILERVTYTELGQSVIRWLNDLRSQGVHVRKIYFDGYLPPFKWDTRKKRLIQQTANVQNLSGKHRTGAKLDTERRLPPRAQDSGTTKPDEIGVESSDEGDTTACRLSSLQYSSRAKHYLDTLPKHPFMIPAVVECLRATSEWHHVIQVVPGEADAFCAQDIKKNGGLLLTSDSDLLIQDLGPEGSVVFLWNLWDRVATQTPDHSKALDTQETVKAEDQNAAFMAIAYSRPNIERHLTIQDLGGLPRLVFEWEQGRESLMEAQKRMMSTSEDQSDEKAYNLFLHEHLPVEYIPEAHPVLKILSDIDPRISELVIQSLNLEVLREKDAPKTTTQPPARGPRGPGELSMFLPMMIEDTSLKSSWEYSQTSRLLAYGLAQNFAQRQHKSVIEYRTLNSMNGGRKVDIPTSGTIDKWCEMLVSTLDQIGGDPQSTAPYSKWLAFALYQEIQLSNAEGASSLAVSFITEVVYRDDMLVNYTWKHIHLSAIIQAALYSLRILKKILEVKAFLNPESITTAQKQLQEHLRGFPPINKWPGVIDLCSELRTFGKADGLAIISDVLGIPEIKLQNSSARLKKKRRAPTTSERGESPAKVARSANPFDALELA